MQNGRQIGQQARFGVDTELVAQLLCTRQRPVGNRHQPGTFGGKISGNQLNHFACADKQDIQIADVGKNLFRQFDGSGSHGNRVFADGSIGTDLFSNRKGFLEQGIEFLTHTFLLLSNPDRILNLS
ncbi:hypothetical protein NM3144_2146 [Neisseria meningitidis NM3144]|nr:hypothetical protein NM3144_2146 [Neisseria meningitidis NM3144]CWS95405.1 Uncharacterised protein [Neisseria meningitidis]